MLKKNFLKYSKESVYEVVVRGGSGQALMGKREVGRIR